MRVRRVAGIALSGADCGAICLTKRPTRPGRRLAAGERHPARFALGGGSVSLAGCPGHPGVKCAVGEEVGERRATDMPPSDPIWVLGIIGASPPPPLNTVQASRHDLTSAPGWQGRSTLALLAWPVPPGATRDGVNPNLTFDSLSLHGPMLQSSARIDSGGTPVPPDGLRRTFACTSSVARSIEN